METDEQLLEKCKKLIEEKLGWGGSELWSHQDFKNLSDLIEEATNVRLSTATLKRIWGKVKYTSKPTITTLDTLARFIDIDNWRVFKLSNAEANDQGHTAKTNARSGAAVHSKSFSEKKPPRKKRYRYWVFPVGIIFVGLSFFYLAQKSDPEDRMALSAENFSFESRRVVSVGVPNSVIFTYDASTAKDTDSLFIQQSWNQNLRQRIRKNENISTSIYYYPGFFLAKLVVNSRIVKEDSVYIQTDGWLPLVVQPNVPVYYKKEDIFHDGVMTLPVDKIRENSINLQPKTPWVEFYNVRNFGGLKSDNFILEAELKNDYSEGSGICQNTEIHIRLAGGVLIVPLSIKGCVSNLKILDADGIREDVSALGCDLGHWVKFRYEVKNRKGRIFINDQKAVDLNLDFNPKELKGLLFRFQGTGSVNYVRLSSTDGKVVYEDNF